MTGNKCIVKNTNAKLGNNKRKQPMFATDSPLQALMASLEACVLSEIFSHSSAKA